MRDFYLIATLLFFMACSTERKDASTLDIPNTSYSVSLEETHEDSKIERLKLGIIETQLKGDTIDFNRPFVARICFDYNSESGWKVNRSDSLNGLVMSVCFDGRTIGNIELEKKWPYDCTYVNDKKFFIKNVQVTPKVGTPNMTFSGWPYRMVYRPLIINSKPYFQDILKWKPYTPSDEDSTKISDWLNKKYFNTDSVIIKQFKKSYKTADSSRKLVNLHMNDGFYFTIPEKDRFKYYDPEGDISEARNGLWFLIKDNKEIEQLAPYLTLIDAGDYNNDKAVEVIFKLQTYNYDGYVMYYNDFQEKIHYGWQYH